VATLFYTPDIGEAKTYTLNEEESRHCIKVLRLPEGTLVHLVDGEGGFYTARIQRADPKRCILEITGVEREFRKPAYKLHIAIAPTKNIDRFEWFLEKATEAGIDEITPLICARSERRTVRTDRLFKRITAAMKQSVRAYHPVLHEPVGFRDFMAEPPSARPYIAHCAPGTKTYLSGTVRAGERVLVLIGPEGDFTPEEVDLALRQGFTALSLGEARLRTETAGLAVCFEMGLLNRS